MAFAFRCGAFISACRGAFIPALLATTLATILTAPFAAQAQVSLHHGAQSTVSNTGEQSAGLRRGSVIAVPIPLQNPTVGTGLVLGGGYLFKTDEGSDPSFVGLGGFKTSNDSEGYALGGKVYFDDNRWQFQGDVGRANLVYDLFVDGSAIEVQQNGDVAQIGGSYGLSDNFSIGLDIAYINSSVGSRSETSRLPGDFASELDLTSATADVVLGYDSRDSTIYPTSGINGSLSAGGGSTLNEGAFDREFGRGLGQVAFYAPVTSRGVVAGQVTACQVGRPTPFYLGCLLGASDAMRGYSPTEYFGDALMSAQIAWRGEAFWRLGYVVFAGTARVGDDLSELGNSQDLYAGGAGLRLRLSNKFPVDLSVDVAVNRFDETSTYIYVGQRF